VIVDWDCDRFAQAVKGGTSRPAGTSQPKNLEKFYNMTKLGAVDKPATIVDRHGKIILWYLPNILQSDHVVSLSQTH
jgi:hypothetical protein